MAIARGLVELQNPANLHLITGSELWFIGTAGESARELVVLRGGDRLELQASHVTVYTVKPSSAFYQGLALDLAADVITCLEVIAGALRPETLDLVKNRLNEIEKRNQTGPESPMQETLAALLPITQTALDRQSLPATSI